MVVFFCFFPGGEDGGCGAYLLGSTGVGLSSSSLKISIFSRWGVGKRGSGCSDGE